MSGPGPGAYARLPVVWDKPIRGDNVVPLAMEAFRVVYIQPVVWIGLCLRTELGNRKSKSEARTHEWRLLDRREHTMGILSFEG